MSLRNKNNDEKQRNIVFKKKKEDKKQSKNNPIAYDYFIINKPVTLFHSRDEFRPRTTFHISVSINLSFSHLSLLRFIFHRP